MSAAATKSGNRRCQAAHRCRERVCRWLRQCPLCRDSVFGSTGRASGTRAVIPEGFHHAERDGYLAVTFRVTSRQGHRPASETHDRRQKPRPTPAATRLLFTLLFLLTGCHSDDSNPETLTADPLALTTETERGPVKVQMRIIPKEPRLSDEPELTLTVIASDGVEVEMPPFGEALGDFIIRDFYEPLAKAADGNQILQQVYTLEPTIVGRLSIDPITVRFTDKRPDGDGREHEIQSEALLLNVATMIESEAPSLTELRPAAAPVEIVQPTPASTWLLRTCVSVGTVLVTIFLWRLARRRKNEEPQLTPQQLAWRELNDLLGQRLSETDVKEYFVQLTAVVRRYIERSTGVNAPDQTTEEFLREMSSQQLFGAEVGRRLEAFLESADLVKFAGFQPDPDAITDATMRAKQFIELTPGEKFDSSTQEAIA